MLTMMISMLILQGLKNEPSITFLCSRFFHEKCEFLSKNKTSPDYTLFRADDWKQVYRWHGECFADASIVGRDRVGLVGEGGGANFVGWIYWNVVKTNLVVPKHFSLSKHVRQITELPHCRCPGDIILLRVQIFQAV